MNTKQFGAFLARCRHDKGLTQAQLAERLHVTDKAVSRWERGIGFPDIQTLEPLAEILDVRVDELIRAERSAPAADRDAETLSIVQATADLVRSRAQEQTAGVLAIFMIVLMSVQSFLSGFANTGGSVFCGGIAAVSLVSVYYYMENRADRASRTIYAVSAALSAAVFVLICVLGCVLG